MRTITTDRLRAAASEEEVVEIVRDYVSDWIPEELARLPENCRPQKVRDGEDLNVWALNLARASVSFEIDPEYLPLVEEMDAFVGHACRRVAELHHAESLPAARKPERETRLSR